ncbi:MAG: lipoyl(octanoyl) transferase LipB [Proteobacteria bacterium]|nr:lipoyl(octanoyl) transferase LipB [Pseudomonadota bacterium]
MVNPPADLVIKRLGLVEYEPTWRDMQTFTDRRDAQTADEIWLLQHPPVYTLGLNGNPEHLLAPADIPVIDIDRGGQVTYHGPGQLVVYPMIDLRRQSLGVRELVSALEQSVIDLAANHGIDAQARADAPGVYVAGRKLASLGLRIRRGCSYHGLAFNIDMDLEPFSRINPCGFEDLEVTQLKDLGGPADLELVATELEQYLLKNLKYTT